MDLNGRGGEKELGRLEGSNHNQDILCEERIFSIKGKQNKERTILHTVDSSEQILY